MKYFRSNEKIPEWKQFEYFDERWKERILQMSKYIPKNTRTVMDLGCGKMWLQSSLDDQIEYIGVDYVKRSENTVVCDFNKKEFPERLVDLIFVSGCLEYINEPEWFIEEISKHCKICVLSYCTLETFPNLKERRQYHWKNHMTKQEIISLFYKYAMQYSAFKKTDANHTIFVFITSNDKH